MEDMDAFERQIAYDVLRAAGPSERVDDLAILSAITARSPWRGLQPVLSAARFVIVAAVVALFGGLLVSGVLTQRPGHEQRSVGAAASPSPSLQPADGPYTNLSGRRSLTVDGVPLSFSLPADSSLPWLWESLKDDLYISNSTVRGQAAEAIILWTSFPDSHHARPCLLGQPSGSSSADLAAEVASAPGIELVSGPSDVTVGGRAAKHVVLSVLPDAMSIEVSDGAFRRDVGCNPGYFFAWEASDAGAFWLDTDPGDTIKVWIVDVDGRLLFIEAETKPDAGETVQQEIEQIIDSIRFE